MVEVQVTVLLSVARTAHGGRRTVLTNHIAQYSHVKTIIVQ